MFLPERYRRNPSRPSRPAPEPATDDDCPPEPDLNAEDGAGDDPDAEAAEAELSDAAFYQSLRQDITGCREGSVPSITDAMRPALKDRPWGPRHKRRDRYGKTEVPQRLSAPIRLNRIRHLIAHAPANMDNCLPR